MRASNRRSVVALLVLPLAWAASAFAGTSGNGAGPVDWGTVLVAPRSVSLTAASRTSLAVAWPASSVSRDGIRYGIYRDGVLQRTTSGRHATVSPLACGRAYAVGVAAADNAGHTSATTTIDVATMPCGDGPAVALAAPRRIGRGAVLRAEVDGSARSVSFGYCRGIGCSWGKATLIGSASGKAPTLAWRALPAQGTYALLARAVDRVGRLASSVPVAVFVDTTPPDTRIVSSPNLLSTSTSASFTVAASERVRLVECSLDRGGFNPCPASFSLAGLPVGSHTVSAYAVDLAGNADQTPATLTWTIDATGSAGGGGAPGGGGGGGGGGGTGGGGGGGTGGGGAGPAPPETTIASAPAGAVGSSTALVAFGSGDVAATFECSLDGAAFAVCASPTLLAGLADGVHSFAVRGRALDGTLDPTPATVSWTVDTVAPVVTVAAARAADGNGWYRAPVVLTTSGSDAGGAVTCTAAQTYAGPDSAAASVSGTCTDVAGNSGSGLLAFRYDATAPETTVVSGPAATTSLTTAVFVLVASEPAVFECRLDGAAFGPCAASPSFGGLALGAHSFVARAVDPAGNVDATPATFVWTVVAVVPPETSITSAPSGSVASKSALVAFNSSDAAATFACSLDGAAFSACASPTLLAGLADGVHSFAVRARALDGTLDPTPATASWTVDTVAPQTTLVSTPAALSASSSASFAFTSSEPGSSFSCKLDANPVVPCLGPLSLGGLGEGSHSFAVAATDQAGNPDSSPAAFAWTVDTVAPDSTVVSGPAATTSLTTAVFVLAASEPAVFECRLDGAAFGPCAASPSFGGLALGAHSFAARAVDPAGNVDATPATFVWTVVAVVPPETSITSAPSGSVASRSALVAFNSSDAAATFACSLDGAAFAVCASPTLLAGLADGVHSFAVRARALDGTLDPTPATVTWTVDTTAPVVTVSAARPADANGWYRAPVVFTTSGTDAGGAVACTAAQTYAGPDSATASVSGSCTDAAGNRGSGSLAFSYDATAPDTAFASTPSPSTNLPAVFDLSSPDPTATFQCSLDTAPFTACAAHVVLGLPSDGSHTFEARAVDSAGNLDATPASLTWLTDATAPTGTITAPADGATVSGAAVGVRASAADNVSVLGVQFSLDGANLGVEDVTGPAYSVTWDTTLTSNGTHTLTAVIRDGAGNRTTTAPVLVTVANATPPPPPATVSVGPGFVDATTRQVIRTAANRVYIIAADDTAAVSNPAHAPTGPGVIRAYKGNQDGIPTAFTEVDAVDHPCSGSCLNPTALSGVDVRLGSDGVARTLFSDNSGSVGTLLFRTFSTVTDTWGATETLDSPVGVMARGKIKYALALDAVNVPHVVYVKSGSLLYRDRTGGVWSGPVTVATGAAIVHPMLAFDATGALHLSWLNDSGSTTSTIMYANRSAGGTWSAPETVAATDVLTDSNADQGPSIAVDSANQPYVLYVSASKGTFGPVGHTAAYGAIRIKTRIAGVWTFDNPTPDVLTHTPQLYLHGNDVYAFNGHDTDINFAYSHQLAGGAWSAEQKLTAVVADGSASIRWDPLHETNPSIIDAAFYDEDMLGNGSFLGKIYYTAVAPF